jgi:NADPH:quinone reductase-like Zn-dependent oxidoreductase
MARVLRLHEFSGVDGIQLDDVPVSEPGPGEIRIDVEAFSLNFGDFHLFENKYVFSMDLPARFGDECAGTVDAVGEDVHDLRVGDRVSTVPWMNEGYGVDGEFAIVPERFAARYPENLSPEEACSIWVPYLTAYYALFEISAITADDYVLITAASSSAGMAAMDMCRMVGARTIGTSRTTSKRELLLGVGFDRVIAQSDGRVSEEIMEFTEGRGVRIIYDPIGGQLVQDYAGGLGQDAIIFLYGGMDPTPTVVPEIEMIHRAAVIRPYSVYNHIYDKESRERGVKFVFDALARGDLKARVEDVYPLEEFRQAFDHQRSSKTRKGKLVISTRM